MKPPSPHPPLIPAPPSRQRALPLPDPFHPVDPQRFPCPSWPPTKPIGSLLPRISIPRFSSQSLPQIGRPSSPIRISTRIQADQASPSPPQIPAQIRTGTAGNFPSPAPTNFRIFTKFIFAILPDPLPRQPNPPISSDTHGTPFIPRPQCRRATLPNPFSIREFDPHFCHCYYYSTTYCVFVIDSTPQLLSNARDASSLPPSPGTCCGQTPALPGCFLRNSPGCCPGADCRAPIPDNASRHIKADICGVDRLAPPY